MCALGISRTDPFIGIRAFNVVPCCGWLSSSTRKEDFPLLLRHFVEKYSALYKKNISGIVRRAQARLAAHDWPGNVRELENVSGGCIMAVGNVIDLHDLPEAFLEPAQVSGLPNEDLVT